MDGHPTEMVLTCVCPFSLCKKRQRDRLGKPQISLYSYERYIKLGMLHHGGSCSSAVEVS